MPLGTLKTLINAGMNLEFSDKNPPYEVIEKKKDYEVRVYKKNRYFYLKTFKKAQTDKDAKKEDDPVTNNIWRLLKYTQTHNEASTSMKFNFPVIVRVDKHAADESSSSSSSSSAKSTTAENAESSADEDEDDNLDVEIKIMVSFPPEYQNDATDAAVKQPPKALDEEIIIESVDEFKCYVRTFPGFANDNEYKKETMKLIKSVREDNKTKADRASRNRFKKNTIMCMAYDPPYKLINRRNEVMLVAI